MKIELVFDLVNLFLVPISGYYCILKFTTLKNQILPYLLFFNFNLKPNFVIFFNATIGLF